MHQGLILPPVTVAIRGLRYFRQPVLVDTQQAAGGRRQAASRSTGNTSDLKKKLWDHNAWGMQNSAINLKPFDESEPFHEVLNASSSKDAYTWKVISSEASTVPKISTGLHVGCVGLGQRPTCSHLANVPGPRNGNGALSYTPV